MSFDEIFRLRELLDLQVEEIRKQKEVLTEEERKELQALLAKLDERELDENELQEYLEQIRAREKREEAQWEKENSMKQKPSCS